MLIVRAKDDIKRNGATGGISEQCSLAPTVCLCVDVRRYVIVCRHPTLFPGPFPPRSTGRRSEVTDKQQTCRHTTRRFHSSPLHTLGSYRSRVGISTSSLRSSIFRQFFSKLVPPGTTKKIIIIPPSPAARNKNTPPFSYMSKDLPRRRQVLLAYLELREHDPHLGESERLVRDHVQTSAIHLTVAIVRTYVHPLHVFVVVVVVEVSNKQCDKKRRLVFRRDTGQGDVDKASETTFQDIL